MNRTNNYPSIVKDCSTRNDRSMTKISSIDIGSNYHPIISLDIYSWIKSNNSSNRVNILSTFEIHVCTFLFKTEIGDK